MAVMESVIGLEIALARFLTNYLASVRGLEVAKVKSFVNPQLGLTDRVAVLLDLTMADRIKGRVDLDKVLTSIRLEMQSCTRRATYRARRKRKLSERVLIQLFG